MKAKRVLLVMLSIVMIFTLVACGGGSGESEGDQNPTYDLKLNAQYAADYPDTISLERAATIAEKTNGAVNIKIYPSGPMGDYTQVYEEVMKGTIDMASITIPSQFDERLEISIIPYLTTNYDEAKRVFSKGSFFYDTFAEINGDLGVQLLNIYMDGYMGIGAAKLDPATVMDPTVKKDTLLRCPPLDLYVATAEGMGFRTTTIAYADLYPALQTGVADGWIGGAALINYTGFRDVIKYYVDNKYIHEVVGTIINKELFEGMPEEYQKIIQETFAEEAILIAEEREATDEKAMADLEAAGVNVIVPTQEEMDNMAGYFRENLWPKFEEKFGKDIMDGLKADASGN